MMVHIVINDKPLCGFTSDRPAYWPIEHRAVCPEEAHFANCWTCISLLNERDELEAGDGRQVRMT